MNNHWDTPITLRSWGSVTRDADGYEVAADPVDVTVWADERSVTRSEFYTALSAGERVERVFRIRAIDYSGEVEVIADDGELYDVVRTYKPSLDDVELNCRRRAGR